MGGYNTLCELLSLQKPAVVVPRVKPVVEQWIRAQRMSELGLFRVVHPDRLTPRQLQHAVSETLDGIDELQATRQRLDLNALPRIGQYITALLSEATATNAANRPDHSWIEKYQRRAVRRRLRDNARALPIEKIEGNLKLL
jgi:predicted glycosyltransferase